MSIEDEEKGVDVEGEIDESVAESAETESPEAVEIPEIDKVRAEAVENRDRYLRAVAELDNFRKRTVKMRAETRDDTLRDVLLQIGPMLDNFRRALGQETEDVASFRQGIEIIFKQFNDILSGYGLIEIQADGQPFDPNLHEALAQVPSAEHPPGTVMQEMEKGYMLNDRVVRPTRVVVSTAMEDEGNNDGDQQADDQQ
ncbi:MAG TPA: nucleotide exchange factor GrpE, partial [Candidatus Latescibacteria bacterium]|nr:nucleotide exchange factor GrpE [Candidatus Latescibacterota bacterium]